LLQEGKAGVRDSSNHMSSSNMGFIHEGS
jgi:hypothetical protein